VPLNSCGESNGKRNCPQDRATDAHHQRSLAAFEWAAKALHWARLPGLYAILATGATEFCTVQFIRTKKRVKNLKKGRDGEGDVAEILDELKCQGANVLHDIPGEKGNIDHVVICSRGIFVVQTKAWSKPENVWEMDFDGECIHIATRAPDAGPIVQCKAEVGDIKSLLKESTSKALPVRGVVVFLDWFVNRKPGARGAEIWVLNPKELGGWVRRESDILSAADVAMATLHLKQFVKKLAA
jgi:hypothetical protein